MPRVTHVKCARKAYPSYGIKKGDSYYWWKFRYGGKRMSKTPPKPSQLTQSEFLGTMYAIQERLESITADSHHDLKSDVEDIISELETLRDDQEEKKSNMPDGLQEGPTGELLQGRYDSVQEMIDELEAIDLDFDEDGDEDEQEWIDERIQEITSVSYNGE